MKRVGNTASNKIYNSKNKKPPVPVDADEADSAMERFIRAKYVQTGSNGGGAKRHDTGRSTESDEGTPPPLPPKTGSRFGFTKSASSTFPLSFRSAKKDPRSTPTSPAEAYERGPNQLRNKSSKVFGQDSPEAMAAKLTQLRDMGFTDDKRNAMVLKGVNGSVEKTIEALVRLGEGGSAIVPPKVPSRDSSLPVSRTLTPQPPFPSPSAAGQSPISAPSNNPWDIQPAQPQSSQSTGTTQSTNNPFYNNSNTNPFGLPGQTGQAALTQSMQNLSLAPPSQQQLFPHHTGGLPAPQPAVTSIHQQSMTPPVPQTQTFASSPFDNSQMIQPTTQYQQQQPTHNYNPFLQTTATQQGVQQQQLTLNTSPFQTQGYPQAQSPSTYGANPFLRSPTRIASPTPLNQIPEQTQQNMYNSPQSPYGNNPFLTASQFMQQPLATPQQVIYQAQQPQQPQQQIQQPFYQAQQPAQMFSQPTYQPQFDKASIMSLFGSGAAPSPFQTQNQPAPNVASPSPFAAQTQQPPPPQRSATAPITGGNNPFLSNSLAPGVSTVQPAPAAPPALVKVNNTPAPMGGARSRESMMVEMGWNNGRHSPDAFASFSARSG